MPTIQRGFPLGAHSIARRHQQAQPIAHDSATGPWNVLYSESTQERAGMIAETELFLDNPADIRMPAPTVRLELRIE